MRNLTSLPEIASPTMRTVIQADTTHKRRGTTNFSTTSGSQAQGSPRTRTVSHPAHLRIPKSQHHSRNNNIVEARNGEVETGGGIVRGTPEIPETLRRRDRRRRRRARSARGQVTSHLTVRAGSTRCLTLVDHCHPPYLCMQVL